MEIDDWSVLDAIRILLAHMEDDVVRMPTRRDFTVARIMLRCWYRGNKQWAIALGLRERCVRYGLDPDTYRLVDREAFELAIKDAEGERYERHLRKAGRSLRKMKGANKPELKDYVSSIEPSREKQGLDMLRKWRKGKEIEEFG
jgi:hypothetical protein